MPTYRPRMHAVLTVGFGGAAAAQRVAQDGDGNSIDIPVRVRRASIDSNDHNHADELKLTIEWVDAGVDPRLLANAVVAFYLGTADPDGSWQPSAKDLRFVGIATRVQRAGRNGQGFTVEMEFQDYTTLFIQTKPFPTKGIPDYSQSLDDAWRRICDNVGVRDPSGTGVLSTVSALRNNLVLRGLDSFPQLGKAVAPRFAKLAKVPVKQGSDAWGVWQQCVGMLGLISFIDREQCVVTTSTNYYTANDPPRFIWGRNILDWQESRRSAIFAKGVGITSFDPITGTTIEALYPPLGDTSILHKRISAKKAGDAATVRQASDYEYFAVPSVTTVQAATDCAKRVYDERSRQELEGTIRTVEMAIDTTQQSKSRQGGTVPASAQPNFDLLNLRAGDAVRVEFDPDNQLITLGSVDARVNYLKARGYSDAAAQLVAKSYDDIARLDPVFHTKRVATSIETDGDGGTFEVEITYCNRIAVSGDVDA